MLDFATPTTTAVPPAITAAAASLATASVRLDTAKAALTAAEKNAAAVRGRVGALEQERAAIGQRRAAGQHEEGDGGRLELMRLDLEGLQPLVAEADAAVASARRKFDAAEGLATSARQQLARVEAEAQLTALVEHAQRLDALMLATIEHITITAAQAGATGRPPYAPSVALVQAVRRAAAAHGVL